ncbi:zinc dependent phospholipase C family protein [Paenibacillus piri]|uniref:Phospholipase C/D domain-containing protein n=1 Tax=Paenibacillus piri TaxID=2547395 RepID=A0A4V2ZTH2_9BACL|nr:zinc dependent phospholipase C family protein [Paenibacillus piri]TDF97134.1 hypothetical protein E1757_14965 [Paenibacillus piri]
MPLPMIHFHVAVNYVDDEDVPASFLLGSIAPDAIHMRKGTTREHKKQTHLSIESSGKSFESVQEIYNDHMLRNDTGEWKWFVRGYFAHLLTDYFWLHDVYKPFKETAERDGVPEQEIRRTYYKDTDQIDFTLYKTKLWTPRVWEKLISTPVFAFAPFLSADEVNFWRLRTIHWFDLLCEEPRVEPAYITNAIAESFILKTAPRVKELLADWDRRCPAAGQDDDGRGIRNARK